MKSFSEFPCGNKTENENAPEKQKDQSCVKLNRDDKKDHNKQLERKPLHRMKHTKS